MQARGDQAGYSGHLDWGLRLVMLLALPCALAMLLLAKPMLAVLFHYGRFTAESVDMCALALRGYGCGLLGMVAIKVLAPGFFARQDMRTPVRISVVVLVCTQLMNLALVPWLAHGGLTLSIGLGALLNAGWLFVGLRRMGVYQPAPGWGSFALRLLPANAVLAGGMFWVAHSFDWIAMQSHSGWRAALLAVVLFGSALAYFGCLRLLGLDLRQFARRA
jgi:putative peptidoglycan lipid II flippase